MGLLQSVQVAPPSVPVAGKVEDFAHSLDGRRKYIDEKGIIYSLGQVSLWNYLDNGGQTFVQRQTPGTLTSYSIIGGRVYAADQWFVGNENASVQYQQVDASAAPETGLLARYYSKIKKITTGGKFYVGQPLLSDNISQLRGRTVRFQGKMKVSVASSMNVRLGIIQLTNSGAVDTIPSNANLFFTALGAVGVDPTPGANLAYIAPKAGVTPDGPGGTVINGNAVDCALTAAWQRFGAVFDIPSNCKNLIPIVWTNGQPAANDELNMTEFALTNGYEIQDFSPMNWADEYWRVAPFYQKSFALRTGPVNNAGLGGSKRYATVATGAVATSWLGAEVRFSAPFFKTPTTITFYNPAAANAFVRNITFSSDATVTAAANQNEMGMHINCTGLAGWGTGNDSAVHWSAEAFL